MYFHACFLLKKNQPMHLIETFICKQPGNTKEEDKK